jgi:YD repeat-containing protein
VGNRLSEETTSGITYFEYDEANRLIEVWGQGYAEYTWDDNGNLLDDGPRSYAYDHANRLVGVSGAGLSASYSYNGLGDRLRQTANSVTTEYVLDMAAGLTQVLSDETNTYLYGLERIGEQQPGGWQFYLGDALGSVRQLTDEVGEISLAKSYLPSGEAISGTGGAA